MSKIKTREQILDYHLSVMLSNPTEDYMTLEQIKETPGYSVCLTAMDKYAEQQSDLIFNLFDKPSQKLKPLEDLYRKENPFPDGRFYSPDTTKFYEWITAKILAMS